MKKPTSHQAALILAACSVKRLIWIQRGIHAEHLTAPEALAPALLDAWKQLDIAIAFIKDETAAAWKDLPLDLVEQENHLVAYQATINPKEKP